MSAVRNRFRRVLHGLRTGDVRGLVDDVRGFVRGRLAALAHRCLPARGARLQRTLQALPAAAPSSPLPPLQQLRAAVRTFLPSPLPRVSAVVPCHDYGRLVLEAVASLRAQDYPALEIVVVDDGSTEAATLAALQELHEVPGVRVLHQANQGLVGARMAGARAATGELLLFLDNDDRVTPECVSLLVAWLHAHPEAAYAYPAQHFFGDEELVWEPQEFDAWDLLWANHPTVCALLRRSVLDDVGGYDAGMRHGMEDWALWIAASRRGHFGVGVPVPLFEHRRHGRTMTHTAKQRGEALRARILEQNAAAYAPAALAARKLRWRPAVSVVVPFGNAHRFWPETLQSLRRQTLDDFELVVVDDASDAPESLAMLAALREAGPEVRVLTRERRGGAAAARNDGVLAARGEFVFLLDADDLLQPTALEQLLWRLLGAPELGFVYPGVRHFGAQTGVCLDAYDPRRLLHENYLTCAAMLRRTVYLQAGGMAADQPQLHEDWDFWLRLLALGIHGALLPLPLFAYRRHDGGRATAVRQGLSPSAQRALLRQRNPVLYGDATVHPPHYAPLGPPPTPLEHLVTDLRARYRLDLGVPYLGHRAPNLPNPLPPRRWADARVHLLLLLPHRRAGDGAADLAALRALPRDRFAVTLVLARDGAGGFAAAAEGLVDEVFELVPTAPERRLALAFLEHLRRSRCVDVLAGGGTALVAEFVDRVRQEEPEVRVLAWPPADAAGLPAVLAQAAAAVDRGRRLQGHLRQLLQGSLL